MIQTGIVAVLLGCAVPCVAQNVDVPPENAPIGRFVADARAAFPKFKQDGTTAAGLGVSAANLPGRALGLVLGAHWYPVRAGIVTFGFGGEVLVAGRSHTLEAASAGAAAGPTVNTRFSALSPQISFNFGARDGWSYISGGIGWSSFTAERADAPLPDQESRSKTINYGGGARWFARKHVALSVDLRFYAVNPQDATSIRPAFPRMTLMAFSVGAAIR